MGQLNDQRLAIDHIIVPSGSAGTYAGMAGGMAGVNGGTPISGINVSRPKAVQEEIVCKLSRE